MKRLPFAHIFAFCAVILSSATFTFAADENRAANSSFEKDTGEWVYLAAGGCQASGDFDTTQHHTGKRSYKLTHKSEFAGNVYSMVSQMTRQLKPYTTYRISAWVKGKDIGLAWVGGGPGWTYRQAFDKGTYNWKQFSLEYSTELDPPDFQLIVATESPTAELYVDDVSMVEIKSDPAKRDQALAAMNALVQEQTTRYAALATKAKQDGDDPYVTLGLSIAKRFLDRVTKPADNVIQSASWSKLQIEEVKTVLDETEKWMGNPHRPKPAPARRPPMGPVTLKDGLLYAASGTAATPYFFYGYGHFDAVDRDLPNFPLLGASIIQDGRVGPSAMSADGVLLPKALKTLKALDTAAAAGMRVDWLLSPHYFPDWAGKKYPDISTNGAYAGFSIDNPNARTIIQQFIEKMGAQMKSKPALLSVCLTNEPTYGGSGHDAWSKPNFIQFIKQQHGTIHALNAAYGASYKSFDNVPVPGGGLPGDVKQQPAYYDWVQFNNKNFADWHAWMSGVIKKNIPGVLTHLKEMVFFTFDRDKLGFGVDPELMSRATDLAGCDAYAFMDSPTYAYSWIGHEFFYDLLHSFKGQDVFNSENHIIPDGSGPSHMPMDHARSAMWQGGLHHQSTSTTWVWEEPKEAALAGSIYLRPSAIYGQGRAALDLNRLASEVAAINLDPPHVALLFSPTSIFWSPTYQASIKSTYTQLNFLGVKTTFVSERQLAEKTAPKLDVVIIPQATHVNAQTLKSLAALADSGTKIILIGDNNLSRDPYNRALDQPPAIKSATKLTPGKEERDSAIALKETLAKFRVKPLAVTDLAGKPMWAIEYRAVDYAGGSLIPIVNLSKESQTVRLPFSKAIDLLTGEPVSNQLELAPMVPMLLRVETK